MKINVNKNISNIKLRDTMEVKLQRLITHRNMSIIHSRWSKAPLSKHLTHPSYGTKVTESYGK